MDLEFSEEEAELRDNVRSVLTGICPPSVVRAVYEHKDATTALWESTAIWQKMVELYWPAIGIAEEHGGLGMGFLEVAIVAEELGRATVPSPFLATVTQFAPVVRELGGSAWLARVAAGEITGTLALAESGRWSTDAVRATARPDGDGWVLDGTKESVVDGATATEVAVVARGDAGLGVFVVAGEALAPKPEVVIDPTTAMATVPLAGVRVAADRVLAAPGTPGVEAALGRAIEEATVAVATMTVGASRAAFDTTLEYAKHREQYGRPIGSFQALQHRLANMYLAVERASALCWFAALTIAEDDSRRAEAASLAKAAAGECQRLVVGDSLQLHGGIGFTWENDLHFLLKRAKTGDALFGNAYAHRARLAQLVGVVA